MYRRNCSKKTAEKKKKKIARERGETSFRSIERFVENCSVCCGMKRLYPVETLFRTTQGSRKRVRLTGWMTGCVVIDWKRRFLFGCASVRRAWGVDEWGDKLRWMRNLWTEVRDIRLEEIEYFYDMYETRDTNRTKTKLINSTQKVNRLVSF